MIEKETIERIKKDVDLSALVRAKGVKLKKNGKSYFGLCPFHDDHNPSLSINPSTNLWQCFGCAAGGDVIRFVELFDQVDFKEAVKRLSDNDFKATGKSKRKEPSIKQPVLSARLLKLLNRVIEFYHTAFAEDPRSKEYLIKRGITDLSACNAQAGNAIFSDFKVGFANGPLLNTLPDEDDIFKQLKRIGVLTEKGN
jgi:DNA primase